MEIAHLLADLAGQDEHVHQMLVMVTHNPEVAGYTDRQLIMQQGRLEQISKNNLAP
jgi:ABC-type lipoprotein export system ATPase subunit